MEREFTLIAKELHELQMKEKYIKELKRKASEKLQELCGGETTSVGSYKYALTERKGSVKYSAIPELKAVDLEQYRGEPVASWRLTHTKQFDI